MILRFREGNLLFPVILSLGWSVRYGGRYALDISSEKKFNEIPNIKENHYSMKCV